jgi:hypothetical protein
MVFSTAGKIFPIEFSASLYTLLVTVFVCWIKFVIEKLISTEDKTLHKLNYCILFLLTILSTMVITCTTFFNVKNLCISCTQCICVFLVILKINNDYLPKQPLPNGLLIGELARFPCDKNLVSKYYLDEF